MLSPVPKRTLNVKVVAYRAWAERLPIGLPFLCQGTTIPQEPELSIVSPENPLGAGSEFEAPPAAEPSPGRYSAREVWDSFVRETLRARGAWGRGAILLLATLVLAWTASPHYPAMMNESMLGFRYAENLVAGNGLVYNPGERADGFENVTWVGLLAAVIALGGDAILWAKILGLLLAAMAIAGSVALADALQGRRSWWSLLAVAPLAFSPHVASWTMMCHWTLVQPALLVWTYARFLRELDDPRAWRVSPWLAALAMISHASAAPMLLPLCLLAGWEVLCRRLSGRAALRWFACAFAPFALGLLLHRWIFGDWFAMQYYSRNPLNFRDRGIAHLTQFFFVESPAFRYLWGGGAIACLLWRRAALVLLCPVLICCAQLYARNGDWMPNYRLLMDCMPFLAVLCAAPATWARSVAPAVLAGLSGPARHMPAVPSAPPLVLIGARRLFIAAIVVCGFILAPAGILLHAAALWNCGVVYIFDKNANLYPREPGWWKFSAVRAVLAKGFQPPLVEVSNWITETCPDGTRLFCGDNGFPQWMNPRIRIVDPDALATPHFLLSPSHAPHGRGLCEYIRDAEQELRAETTARQAASAPGAPVIGPGTSQLWAARAEARVRYNRDVRDIAATALLGNPPEFLNIYSVHGTTSPTSRVVATYPESATALRKDSRFDERYEELRVIPKAHTTFAHLYGLRARPSAPTAPQIALRWQESVRRAPRVSYLYAKLAAALQPAALESDPESAALLREGLARFPDDTFRARLHDSMTSPTRLLVFGSKSEASTATRHAGGAAAREQALSAH